MVTCSFKKALLGRLFRFCIFLFFNCYEYFLLPARAAPKPTKRAHDPIPHQSRAGSTLVIVNHDGVWSLFSCKFHCRATFEVVNREEVTRCSPFPRKGNTKRGERETRTLRDDICPRCLPRSFVHFRYGSLLRRLEDSVRFGSIQPTAWAE